MDEEFDDFNIGKSKIEISEIQPRSLLGSQKEKIKKKKKPIMSILDKTPISTGKKKLKKPSIDEIEQELVSSALKQPKNESDDEIQM